MITAPITLTHGNHGPSDPAIKRPTVNNIPIKTFIPSSIFVAPEGGPGLYLRVTLSDLQQIYIGASIFLVKDNIIHISIPPIVISRALVLCRGELPGAVQI